MLPDQFDSKLLADAIAGDESALKMALAACYRPLANKVSGRIPPDLQRIIDIDDIVQEAYIEVFRRISAFENRGPGSFDRWVRTIAMNRLRNAIRKERALRRGGALSAPTQQATAESSIALLDALTGSSWTASRSVAKREAEQILHAALDALPKQYHVALRLVYLEGRTVHEAAVSMKSTERAVHGLCRRGVSLLREQMQGHLSLIKSQD